eukprot:m.971604 g.971604  ORF g.971604 m.971604 type:complete len:1256 (+) comp23927_c0_seq18:392-4159(+)
MDLSDDNSDENVCARRQPSIGGVQGWRRKRAGKVIDDNYDVDDQPRSLRVKQRRRQTKIGLSQTASSTYESGKDHRVHKRASSSPSVRRQSRHVVISDDDDDDNDDDNEIAANAADTNLLSVGTDGMLPEFELPERANRAGQLFRTETDTALQGPAVVVPNATDQQPLESNSLDTPSRSLRRSRRSQSSPKRHAALERLKQSPRRVHQAARDASDVMATRPTPSRAPRVPRHIFDSGSGSDSTGSDSDGGMEYTAEADLMAKEDDEWLVDDEKTNTRNENVFCACGCQDGDTISDGLNYRGLWVRCTNELCEAWGHAVCFDYMTKSDIPRKFLCVRCDSSGASTNRRSRDRTVELQMFEAADNGNVSELQRLLMTGVSRPMPTGTRKKRGKATTRSRRGVEKGCVSPRADRSELVNWRNGMQRTHRGRSMLHAAAARGHADCVRTLLDADACLHCEDLDNLTPLDLATSGGHTECVETLLAAIPSLCSQKSHGHTRTAGKMSEADLVRLIHTASESATDNVACLECILNTHNARSLVNAPDEHGYFAVHAAAAAGAVQCLTRLVAAGADPTQRVHDTGGTIVHLAARSGSVACLAHAIAALNDKNAPGCNESRSPDVATSVDTSMGWPPLFYAADAGAVATVRALLADHRVPVFAQDRDGASALHLAALGGFEGVVDELIGHGHPVDCQDNMHWLPLLYADFTANRACVLSLMRPKPEQLAVLGRLLEAPTDTEDQRVKNTAAVTRVIVALATTPEYYATLNQFLREHPHLLRNELSFLWKYQGLIDLENKIAHFHASLLELKRQSPAHPCSLSVDRSSLLDSLHMSLVHEELSSGCPQRNLLHGFEVSFQGEDGMMLGPKREFLGLLAAEVVRPSLHMLRPIDGDASLYFPCAVFDRNGYAAGGATCVARAHSRSATELPWQRRSNALNVSEQSESPNDPQHEEWACMRLDYFNTLGKMIGAVLACSMNIGLRLAPAFVKQILSASSDALEHPADLEPFDPASHRSLTYMLQNDPSDLDMTFSWDVTHTNLASMGNPTLPASATREATTTIPLSTTCSAATPVTVANVAAYVERVSWFKLSGSVALEIEQMRAGLHSVVPEVSRYIVPSPQGSRTCAHRKTLHGSICSIYADRLQSFYAVAFCIGMHSSCVPSLPHPRVGHPMGSFRSGFPKFHKGCIFNRIGSVLLLSQHLEGNVALLTFDGGWFKGTRGVAVPIAICSRRASSGDKEQIFPTMTSTYSEYPCVLPCVLAPEQ